MNSILSSISGQFSKSLVLGTLLPVLLFVILGMVFVLPLFPYDWHFLGPLVALDSRTVVVFTLVTIVISGLLYSFNDAIRNVYEGYPWRYTWAGQWKTRQYRAQLRAARSFMSRTLVLRNELSRRDYEKYERLIERIENERTVVGQKINNEFPSEAYLVLPTRLGNVVRSSETYPHRQYRISGVTLWPRLRAQVDKDYMSAIDDAKTPLDFVINISFLSALLSIAILLTGLLYPVPPVSRRAGVWWGVEFLGFAFLSYLAYKLAIIQSREWGNLFRGAFDLYRWAVLKQLGYRRVPTNISEERALWGGIYRQMMYGDPPAGRLPDYATSDTFAYGYLGGDPYAIGLEVARGVSLPDANGVIAVTISVKNVDGQRRTIKSVVLRDLLPEGYTYIWNSIQTVRAKISVSGSNPLYFELNHLQHGEQTILSYLLLPQDKQ